MKVINFVLILLLGFCDIFALKELPKEFKRCYKGPDLNNCLVEAINLALTLLKDGNKELGVMPLEPFVVPHLVFERKTRGAIMVHQDYKNMTIYDFVTNTKVRKCNFDWDKKTFSTEAFNSHAQMESTYSVKGRVLLLPIEGHGNFNATFINCTITQNAKFEVTEKRGETYLHLTSIETFFQPQDVKFYFDNLIDGQKLITDEINKIFADNWRDLWTEQEPFLANAFSEISLKAINKVFGQIPMNKVF